MKLGTVILIFLSTLLSACATPEDRARYAQEEAFRAASCSTDDLIEQPFVVAAPFDEVWTASLSAASGAGLIIKSTDKNGGLIYAQEPKGTFTTNAFGLDDTRVNMNVIISHNTVEAQTSVQTTAQVENIFMQGHGKMKEFRRSLFKTLNASDQNHPFTCSKIHDKKE